MFIIDKKSGLIHNNNDRGLKLQYIPKLLEEGRIKIEKNHCHYRYRHIVLAYLCFTSIPRFQMKP